MNERAELLTHVSETLKKSDFEVSERCTIRASSFDVFARRGILLLLLKILTNIDSLSEGQATDITNVCHMLSASPLLIGRRTRNSYMPDGVVYERHGIYALTPETLGEILMKHILPLVLSARGGYYVKIDGVHLREVRMERDVSLGGLAEKVGISRRMVLKYEREGAMATFETAMRLEEYLNEALTIPIEIFSIPREISPDVEIKNEFGRVILNRLSELGFLVCPVRRAPFDALTEKDEDLLMAKVSQSHLGIRKKAKILKSLSDTAKTDAFFVVERREEDSLNGIPVIRKKELEEIDEPSALVETLVQRREK